LLESVLLLVFLNFQPSLLTLLILLLLMFLLLLALSLSLLMLHQLNYWRLMLTAGVSAVARVSYFACIAAFASFHAIPNLPANTLFACCC
jgi:hypothetical protein